MTDEQTSVSITFDRATKTYQGNETPAVSYTHLTLPTKA